MACRVLAFEKWKLKMDAKEYRFNDCNVCLNADQHTLRFGRSIIIVETAQDGGRWFFGYEYHIFLKGGGYDGGASPCMRGYKENYSTQNEAIAAGFRYFKKRKPSLKRRINEYLETVICPKQLSLF